MSCLINAQCLGGGGGENTNAFQVLAGKKPKRRRPLGRPRCRWEDTVEVDLQRIQCETVDGIDPAQDREKLTVVNRVKRLGFREMQKFLDYENFLSSQEVFFSL